MTNIEIGMMVAFILALVFSGWKLYAFMPKEPLKDDDTNSTATYELKMMMYKHIKNGVLEEELLLVEMQNDPEFDKEHFWRFNLNRLRQLLQSHYIENPDHQDLKEIHTHLNTKVDDQSASK